MEENVSNLVKKNFPYWINFGRVSGRFFKIKVDDVFQLQEWSPKGAPQKPNAILHHLAAIHVVTDD